MRCIFDNSFSKALLNLAEKKTELSVVENSMRQQKIAFYSPASHIDHKFKILLIKQKWRKQTSSAMNTISKNQLVKSEIITYKL